MYVEIIMNLADLCRSSLACPAGQSVHAGLQSAGSAQGLTFTGWSALVQTAVAYNTTGPVQATSLSQGRFNGFEAS